MRKNKKRLNNKKGISLIVAIALTLVLTLTTTTFISLAMLQQNETGGELNSRQAYISAKSALELAEELINANTIIPPTTNSEKYYVFYYDSANNLNFYSCNTADEAKFKIEDLRKNHPEYTIVGNSYVKIKNDGTGNCTMTAISIEDKYTNNSSYDRNGDLSIGFHVSVEPKPDPQNVNLEIKVKEPQPPAPSNSNRFMMVGAQTNFSLLKSGGVLFNHNLSVNTIQRYEKPNGQIIFGTFVETASAPIDSRFPLVYTNTVKINSDSYRCTYNAYDEGVYFLGDYSGSELSDYANPQATNVSYFTNNSAYGVEIGCRLLVIERNMVTRKNDNDHGKLIIKNCGSSNYKYGNSKGVIVYLPNGSIFSVYDNNRNEIKSLRQVKSPGYYWLPSGKDLFDPSNGMAFISKNEPINDPRYTQLNGINMYSQLKNSDGEMHSAYENEGFGSTDAVQILNSEGLFMSTSKIHSKTSKTSFYSGWGNYSIYCAPLKMPIPDSNTNYYDLYCGKTFNYLWYNVYDMSVEKNIKMSIRSNHTVLTIGPDMGEEVYETKNSSGSSVHSYVPSDSTINKTATVKSKIIGKSGAEFWIRPYWNESTYSFTVMNNFTVQLSDGTTYTVSKGDYSKNLPSGGINLLSQDGKEFFENHSGESVTSEAIGWTDSSGKIINAEPAEKKDMCVDFVAKSGEFYTSGNYKAKSITLDLSQYSSNTINTKGIGLTADYVSINTGGKSLQGDALYINTSSGDSVAKINGTEEKGHVLVVKSECSLYDSSGNLIYELKPGNYFFKTTNSSVNIMSKKVWEDREAYLSTDPNSSNGQQLGTTNKIITTFEEGRYY